MANGATVRERADKQCTCARSDVYLHLRIAHANNCVLRQRLEQIVEKPSALLGEEDLHHRSATVTATEIFRHIAS